METNYGFVNDNNLLIGIASCKENDIETIERVKQEYGASAYYLIGDAVPTIERSIWTGSFFTPGSPYPSWVWDNEVLSWQPPIPYPSAKQERKVAFDWDEEIGNWVEIEISDLLTE